MKGISDFSTYLKNRYKISLSAKKCLDSPLRKVAEKIFQKAGLSSRDVFRLGCVFDEVFLNAFKYGTKKGGYVHVIFEWEWGKYAKVIIDDEGGEYLQTPEKIRAYVLKQIENEDPVKHSGRGLAQIASKWSDTLRILKSPYGGIRVIFQKFIPKQSPQKYHTHAPFDDSNSFS